MGVVVSEAFAIWRLRNGLMLRGDVAPFLSFVSTFNAKITILHKGKRKKEDVESTSETDLYEGDVLIAEARKDGVRAKAIFYEDAARFERWFSEDVDRNVSLEEMEELAQRWKEAREEVPLGEGKAADSGLFVLFAGEEQERGFWRSVVKIACGKEASGDALMEHATERLYLLCDKMRVGGGKVSLWGVGDVWEEEDPLSSAGQLNGFLLSTRNGDAELQDLSPIPDEVVRAVYQHEFTAILWLGCLAFVGCAVLFVAAVVTSFFNWSLAKYMWAAWGASLLVLIFVLVFIGGAEGVKRRRVAAAVRLAITGR